MTDAGAAGRMGRKAGDAVGGFVPVVGMKNELPQCFKYGYGVKEPVYREKGGGGLHARPAVAADDGNGKIKVDAHAGDKAFK